MSDSSTAPAPTALPSDLGRRATRGAVLALVGFGAGRLLGVIASPLLSHLLPPSARGLMEWINPFLLGFELLTDIGLGPAIVHGARGGEPAFLDVAWTLQLTRGLLVWAAVCVFALPYAGLVHQPELGLLVPVAGLSAAFGGFASTRIHAVSRELVLGRLTAIELSAQIIGFAAKLAWAWVSPTAWSLVLGGLATGLVRALLSHLVLPGPAHRLRWDRSVTRELLQFGRWVFVSTVLTFLAGWADRWIFGGMIPLAMLGLYGNAVALASMPVEALSQLAQRVVFPLYARVVRSGEPLGPSFRRARLPIQLAGGWSLAGLVAGGPTAMRWLYDPRWWDSGWMVQILAGASWFLVCESTHGAALLARGDARSVAAGSLAKLVGMAVLVPAGYLLFGFPGALVAYTLSEPLRYAVSVVAVSRIGLSEWRTDAVLTACVAATGGLGAWAAAAMKTRGAPPVVEALGVAAVVTLAWAPIALVGLRASARSASGVAHASPPTPRLGVSA